jgi:16S rRNA (uracil1498-N3)-methyltransferase
MRRLTAHPKGEPIFKLNVATPLATHIAIGPEGGITDAEIATADAAGWQTVDLGTRILRVETAAVALAAVVALSARS